MASRIKRTRLIERIIGAPRQMWSIEAGAGYGKSVLLDQLGDALAEPLIHVRPSVTDADVAAFISEVGVASAMLGLEFGETQPDPRLLVRALNELDAALIVDDAHLWGEAVGLLLEDLASDPMLDAEILVAGRMAYRRDTTTGSSIQTIGTADLAFNLPEVHELLVSYRVDDENMSRVLHELSDGWPLAVDSAAARITSAPDPSSVIRRLARRGSLPRDTIKPYFATLSVSDQQAAVALAGLPFFDAELADRAGTTGIFDRLRIAGLPIQRRADGWFELVPSFRLSLRAEGVPAIQPELVQYLADKGEIQTAITAFLASGDRARAAQLLANVTRRQEAGLDPTQLHAAVAAIGDAADDTPRCLYVHAHVSAVHGHIAEGLISIERAASLFEQQDPDDADPAHVETLLMLGLWRTFDGDLDAAKALVDRCERVVDTSTATEHRAMLHDLRGSLHHQLATDHDLELAASEYHAALELWQQLGETAMATTSVFRLGPGVLVSSGRYVEALTLLDQLPSMGPMRTLDRGRLAVDRACILPYLGRLSEVAGEITAGQRIAELLDDKWLYARSLAADIVAASFDYRGDRVKELAARALDEGYVTFVDAAEAHLWVDVIEAMARCDEPQEAERQLDAVRSVPGALNWIIAYIEASLEARHGSALSAIRLLDELACREDVERQKRWLLSALRAYASHRLGDSDEAERHLARSYESASDLGLPSLPDIVEPRIVAQIRDAQRPAAPTSNMFLVQVFGRFLVRQHDGVVQVAGGHPSTILKVLATHDGRRTIDQLIDTLWPDASIDVGRRRLRNVLARLNQQQRLISRDGDTVSLEAGVEVDYLIALKAVAAALRVAAPLSQVAAAVKLFDQQLMPDNPYDEWAIQARTEHAKELLRLLDRHAAMLEQHGHVEDAVASLRRGHALDEFATSDSRLQAAAALLHGAGRHAEAAALERSIDS